MFNKRGLSINVIPGLESIAESWSPALWLAVLVMFPEMNLGVHVMPLDVLQTARIKHLPHFELYAQFNNHSHYFFFF